jgi:hypothetical protein
MTPLSKPKVRQYMAMVSQDGLNPDGLHPVDEDDDMDEGECWGLG